MEGLELICFEIISSVGMARSLYIEAIQEAKAGNFEQAQELIKQGDESFTEGHHSHAKLLCLLEISGFRFLHGFDVK